MDNYTTGLSLNVCVKIVGVQTCTLHEKRVVPPKVQPYDNKLVSQANTLYVLFSILEIY